MRGLLGIAVLLLIAWGLSEDRFRVPVRVVVAGLALQFVLAVVFIKFPTPGNLDDYAYAGSYLQSFAGNVSDTSAVMLDLYAASTDWARHLPLWFTVQYVGHVFAVLAARRKWVPGNNAVYGVAKAAATK